MLAAVVAIALGVGEPTVPPPGLADFPRDTADVAVTWHASGGSISSLGLFTAGSATGRFRIVATAGRVEGSVVVTLATPPQPASTFPPSPPAPRPAPAKAPPPVTAAAAAGTGIPFGFFGARAGAELDRSSDGFTLSIATQTPRNILERIQGARASGRKLILAMAGGAHRQYLTTGVFDMDKWMRKMDEYNRPEIRDAVAAGVADGVILGNSVMDEPNNTSPDNSWGPKGTMTKARVDSMCAYVKGVFPTLPVGVVHDYRVFDPDHEYSACEFVISQYSEAKGSVTAYRDGGLAFARRNGIAIAFSLNVLDGGTRVKGCPVPETGGQGTFGSNCRMRADQVRDYGAVLGPAGCALVMWRYDPQFMADPDNQRAFRDLADRLASAPAPGCRRP